MDEKQETLNAHRTYTNNIPRCNSYFLDIMPHISDHIRTSPYLYEFQDPNVTVSRAYQITCVRFEILARHVSPVVPLLTARIFSQNRGPGCPAVLLPQPIKFNCTLYTEFAIAAPQFSWQADDLKKLDSKFLSAIPAPYHLPSPPQPSLLFFSFLLPSRSFCSRFAAIVITIYIRNPGTTAGSYRRRYTRISLPGLRRAGSVRGLRLKPELFMRYCTLVLE